MCGVQYDNGKLYIYAFKLRVFRCVHRDDVLSFFESSSVQPKVRKPQQKQQKTQKPPKPAWVSVISYIRYYHYEYSFKLYWILIGKQSTIKRVLLTIVIISLI